MSLVNKETLKAEHKKQNLKKANGIDGMSKNVHGQNLEENLNDLVNR